MSGHRGLCVLRKGSVCPGMGSEQASGLLVCVCGGRAVGWEARGLWPVGEGIGMATICLEEGQPSVGLSGVAKPTPRLGGSGKSRVLSVVLSRHRDRARSVPPEGRVSPSGAGEGSGPAWPRSEVGLPVGVARGGGGWGRGGKGAVAAGWAGDRSAGPEGGSVRVQARPRASRARSRPPAQRPGRTHAPSTP